MSAVPEKPRKGGTAHGENSYDRRSRERPRTQLRRPARSQAFDSRRTSGQGTNPEQLFAAGWSACFEGAMAVVARKRKIALPDDLAIDAEVDLNLGDDGWFLRARLNVSMPGMERDVAQALVDAAHKTCPYSKATRGNVDVTITVV